MIGIRVAHVPGTRKYVIVQSYTLLGILLLGFAATASLPAFFLPDLRDHPWALWTVRLLFCVGPGLLGLGALSRRQETVLDGEARSFLHVESWMGTSRRSSGSLAKEDALEFVLTERPRSPIGGDPLTWSAVLRLSVQGRKLPVFEASQYPRTRSCRRWDRDLFLDSMSAEEFVRRLADDTGLRLEADLPRFWTR